MRTVSKSHHVYSMLQMHDNSTSKVVIEFIRHILDSFIFQI